MATSARMAAAIAALLASMPQLALAQSENPLREDDEIARRSLETVDDPTFGPMLIIEDIEIAGNNSTASWFILRLLPIARGDILRAGDPRFQRARYKLLATGYFREVTLAPRRGSKRGHVILTVEVVERGTIVLNNLYFGTSLSTPWWAGLDITERNFYGTGLGIGAGGIYAARGDIEGASDQWAVELRLVDSSIVGTRYGVHGAVLYAQASEPYRVTGDPESGAAENFRAFDYSRWGLRGGMSIHLSPLTSLSLGARIDWVDADPPLAPTRELADGTIVPIDIGLDPGKSRVHVASVTFDRDTRANPVLPSGGDRLLVLGEVGATWLGGSYDYALALARYQHWWPVRGKKHILSLHLTGGLVLGSAPQFDQLHVSDFNRLLPPRVFGMVLSTTPPLDVFDTGTADRSYGEVGTSAIVEYSYQLFRDRFCVYGGDLFIGGGLWGLWQRRDFTVRDRDIPGAIGLDIVVDAGLRIDTEIGIFELTFANALGRLPL